MDTNRHEFRTFSQKEAKRAKSELDFVAFAIFCLKIRSA